MSASAACSTDVAAELADRRRTGHVRGRSSWPPAIGWRSTSTPNASTTPSTRSPTGSPDVAGIEPAVAADLLKVRVGAPVAAHLFTVAAGLDSMVVGEAEISGQVSRALTAAHAAGTTTPVLHSLFQSAARTAKQVACRHGSGIGGPLGRLGGHRHRRRRTADGGSAPARRTSAGHVHLPDHRHRRLRQGRRRGPARAGMHTAAGVLAQRAGRVVRRHPSRRSGAAPSSSPMPSARPTWWSPAAGPPAACWTSAPSRPRSPAGTHPLPGHRPGPAAGRLRRGPGAAGSPGHRPAHRRRRRGSRAPRGDRRRAGHRHRRGGEIRGRPGDPHPGPGRGGAAATRLARRREGDGAAAGASTTARSPPRWSGRCTGSPSRCCTPRRCAPRNWPGPVTAPATCRRCTPCSASSSTQT